MKNKKARNKTKSSSYMLDQKFNQLFFIWKALAAIVLPNSVIDLENIDSVNELQKFMAAFIYGKQSSTVKNNTRTSKIQERYTLGTPSYNQNQSKENYDSMNQPNTRCKQSKSFIVPYLLTLPSK